jgi:putative spermidine/putrescine transport system permease protein
VVAAAIVSFIVSFTDLEMSLFLVGPGRSTLQIAMLQYLEWKFDPTVAAVSVVQIGIIGVGLMVTDRFVKLSKVV